MRLARLYISHEIPAYADNPVLVRWLFGRFGFGGANAMKAESLKKLLLDPEKSSAEILKHGRRLAECADEELGKMIRLAAETLARRVSS